MDLGRRDQQRVVTAMARERVHEARRQRAGADRDAGIDRVDPVREKVRNPVEPFEQRSRARVRPGSGDRRGDLGQGGGREIERGVVVVAPAPQGLGLRRSQDGEQGRIDQPGMFRALILEVSDQVEAHFAPQHFGGALQCRQSDVAICWVEQPTDLAAARSHAFRETATGELLNLHRFLDLVRENFLDGDGLKGFAGAFLFEESIKGRKILSSSGLLCHDRLLFEFSFPLARQLQVARRGLLGLLDDPMERQQDGPW